MELKARTAVVTGASRGIGRAVAVELARRGAEVALLARTEKGLDETRAAIEQAGGTATVHPVDLTDIAATSAIAHTLAERPVVVLANIAAVWHDDERAFQGPPLHETPLLETLQVMQVGIVAPMILSALLVPAMIRTGGGHVINLSGTFSDGAKGWMHYYVSKRALECFTQGLAQELRDFEIQVNCISPADVATEPYERFYPEYVDSALKPEEVAEAVGAFLDEHSRHVTGQVVEVRNRADHG